jgi:hypothetical protein
MTEAIDPNKAIDFLLKNAEKYAQAKAQRIYLEEFRKSKKATLMSQCEEKAANAREQFAYSHPEYTELLAGLRSAVQIEEELRWQQIAAQLRVEVWRSQEASNRGLERATR